MFCWPVNLFTAVVYGRYTVILSAPNEPESLYPTPIIVKGCLLNIIVLPIGSTPSKNSFCVKLSMIIFDLENLKSSNSKSLPCVIVTPETLSKFSLPLLRLASIFLLPYVSNPVALILGVA